MANQQELDYVYMQVAWKHASLSKAIRKQVGAALVTPQGVILTGFNGTPVGLPNHCENQILDSNGHSVLVTKPEVIHAETNAILKAAREGVSCLGATMYVTLSPCVPCAAMLVNAGISRLLYRHVYRDDSGIDLLKEAGILVEQFKE